MKIGNTHVVQARLQHYAAKPVRDYRTDTGVSEKQERAAQKLRQYWADTKIPAVEKLQGLSHDLSTFDPRNTSRRELAAIGNALMELGVLHSWGVGEMALFCTEPERRNRVPIVDGPVDLYRQIGELPRWPTLSPRFSSRPDALDAFTDNRMLMQVVKALQQVGGIQRGIKV